MQKPALTELRIRYQPVEQQTTELQTTETTDLRSKIKGSQIRVVTGVALCQREEGQPNVTYNL